MKSVDQTKKPTHKVFAIIGEGKYAKWRQVGVAWTHKDQKGLSQNLHILGLETKLVVREVEDEPETASEPLMYNEDETIEESA